MEEQDSTYDPRERADSYDPLWPGWTDFWESNVGYGLAIALLVVVSGVMFFGNLGALGIWEPWEANEILVAQEYDDRPTPPPASELAPKQPSYNWAVPTQNKEPVARSLLKTWLVSWSIVDGVDERGNPRVGALEFSARLPFALAMLIIALGGFFWLRDVFDTWSALLGVAAFSTAPAIFFGVHTVSSESLFVATTTAAIIAYAKLVYAEGGLRYLWGLLFGLGLALSFLDQRYFGLLVPLTTIVTFGLTQLPFELAAAEQHPDDPRILGWTEKGLATAALLAGGAFAWWGFSRSAQLPGDALLVPHVEQLFAVALPGFVLLAGLLLAWQTRPIRRLRSLPGLLGLAIAGGAIFAVLEAYADANPTLLKYGRIVDGIPVLEYALQNHLFGVNFPEGRLHFAMWIRQLGFSMVPWAAFVPLGIGYLARSARLTNETGALRDNLLSEAESVRRLLLVWAFVGVLVVGGASLYDHYYFPGYFPMLVAAGMMFADAEFWRRARLDSLLAYFMGFAAIAILFMLGKDLERFPARLLESYMMFEAEVGLPEEFGYGALLDGMKYLWVGTSAVFFFGVLSRTLHQKYRDAFLPAAYLTILLGIPYGLRETIDPDFTGLTTGLAVGATAAGLVWLASAASIPVLRGFDFSEKGVEAPSALSLDTVALDALTVAWAAGVAGAGWIAYTWLSNPALLAIPAAFGLGTLFLIFQFRESGLAWLRRRWNHLKELFSDEGSPMVQRAEEKEQFRHESSIWSRIAGVFEAGPTFGAVIAVVFFGSASVLLYRVAPELGHHLSQRGIFETYTEVSDENEKLWRMRVSTRDTSVYLRDVPRLKGTHEFIEKFDGEERFFAVIPRDDLSSLNSRIRKSHDRNIPVLDARSSQLLLISNKLQDDERDANFVAEAIVEDPSVIDHEVTFEHDGEQKHPVFDGRIKLLGYSLDQPGKVPAYGWGETATLTTYFEVLKPIPTNQQIFLHVDHPGSRIHGDHYPTNGDFPTSDWLPGDIVKDVHNLKIDPYSTTGEYTMYFGFYRAGSRMEVRPPSAHDGQNRVPMGKIEVTGF